MKQTTCAIALVLSSLISAVHAADFPTGTWKVTVSYGSRDRSSILKLRQEGDRLTGIWFHQLGHTSQLEDVKYQGGRLSFAVKDRRSRQGIPTRYSATVSGDSLQGTTTFRRRGEGRELTWVAKRTFDTPLSPEKVEIPPIEADIDLNDENYSVWRNHILPNSDELAWQQIPWLTTFKDGVLAAAAAQKPLLLWTMNGHPLGCT